MKCETQSGTYILKLSWECETFPKELNFLDYIWFCEMGREINVNLKQYTPIQLSKLILK